MVAVILANFSFTRWFIGYAEAKSLTDIPNERSSHTSPTPSSGGVGFVLFTLTGWLVYLSFSNSWNIGFMTYYLVAVIIAILGWLDDRHELSRVVRFLIQTIAAIAIISFINWFDYVYVPNIGVVQLGVLGGLFFSWLWIVGIVNIYNFMDGVDGIASVQAIAASTGWMLFSAWYDLPELFSLNLFLLAGVAVIASVRALSAATGWLLFSAWYHLPELFSLNLFLLAAVTTFLLFNWAPARIFMGDTGSLFLGLTYATMPFMAMQLTNVPPSGFIIWVAVLLLWPFLFDGIYTIIRRAVRGENIFQAHRSHLYQRLNRSGWNHENISILYLLGSVLSGLFAFWVLIQENITFLFVFLLLFVSTYYATRIVKAI